MIPAGVLQRDPHDPVRIFDRGLGEALFSELPVHIIQHGRGELVQEHISDIGEDMVLHVAPIAGLCAGAEIGRAMPVDPFRHVLPHRHFPLNSRGRRVCRVRQLRFHLRLMLQGVLLCQEALAGIGFTLSAGLVLDIHIVHSAGLSGEFSRAVALVFHGPLCNSHISFLHSSFWSRRRFLRSRNRRLLILTDSGPGDKI